MKLAYEWPADWVAKVVSTSLTEVAIAESLTIRMRASLPLPAGIVTWIAGAMTEQAPADTKAREVRSSRKESLFGWPVAISEYVFEDQNSRTVEMRVGVFFRLLYNGAEVVLRGTDPVRYAKETPSILERMLAAQIVWPRDRAGTLYDLTQL